MIYARVKQHVSVPPAFLSPELHALQIVVINFTHVITTETLSFELVIFLHLAFGDFTIIVLVPLFSSTFIPEMKFVSVKLLH
jgi:hypothetical protein